MEWRQCVSNSFLIKVLKPKVAEPGRSNGGELKERTLLAQRDWVGVLRGLCLRIN
jgi:hypothetical protein